MEASQNGVNANPNPNSSAARSSPYPSSSLRFDHPLWPTIDGPLGLTEEESLKYARNFFHFGFALLPWLWALNCFYFYPVLLHSRSFPTFRRYVVGSAVGFVIFTTILLSWALLFAIGGERLFGNTWNELVMYNVADKWGLTSWS